MDSNKCGTQIETQNYTKCSKPLVQQVYKPKTTIVSIFFGGRTHIQRWPHPFLGRHVVFNKYKYGAHEAENSDEHTTIMSHPIPSHLWNVHGISMSWRLLNMGNSTSCSQVPNPNQIICITGGWVSLVPGSTAIVEKEDKQIRTILSHHYDHGMVK